MLNRRFENYLEAEQETRFERIYREINTYYIENNFSINAMSLMHYSVTENIDIIIKDDLGNIVHNTKAGMGHMGMNRRRMNMMHRMPDGNYVEKSYPLIDENKEVGTLIIGYIDNSYLTDSALIFKNTLTISLVFSGIIAIIIGIFFSLSISNRLTKPLLNITETAEKIRDGNLHAKSIISSDTVEIVTLSETINYLGDSLSKQDDIRKRYASDISHELRTPLTTLKTHIEAIMDRIWEPTDEHLDILLKEVHRLLNLVNDLKDSFTMEEYMHLNKKQFDISKELETVIDSYKPLFFKENYILSTSIEKNIEVFMDLDKFKQIVSNLLSNSLRYLNENGRVNVQLRKDKKNIFMTVKDNGIGIKEDDLKHIFDRFYRADTSRNKFTGGTGLGLAIVKSIVEAHNGTIVIESKFGKGTEVKIALPLVH
jgi:signal transduction histidine kinase